jgi:hypothetical protein
MYNVERDLNNLGLKGWITRAFDRTEWVSFLRKAIAELKGP